jgi:hypothetical protein
MVAAMARSLLAGGTPLVVFAPRPGAVRDLAGLPGVLATVTGDDVTPADVAVLLDRLGVVLVVDDGELLIDCSAKAELRTSVRGLVDNGQGLVLGGNTTGLAAGFGGWQVDAKKSRRGALLSPQGTLAGDLVAVRISRSSISSRLHPGTALVHLGTGLASTVQVAMVTATTRTGRPTRRPLSSPSAPSACRRMSRPAWRPGSAEPFRLTKHGWPVTPGLDPAPWEPPEWNRTEGLFVKSVLHSGSLDREPSTLS